METFLPIAIPLAGLCSIALMLFVDMENRRFRSWTKE
jgi:hypothetical protein